MNIKQLQEALAAYTDVWISQQHVAERSALRMERIELEYKLACALAADGKGERGVLAA